MVSLRILFTIAVMVGGCFAQLPNHVTIRLTDNRYGYLCYKNSTIPHLLFQGTTPCNPATCFDTYSNIYYSLASTELCMSLITPTNEQIILKPCALSNNPVPFYYDSVDRQLKVYGKQNQCLIPYAVAGRVVPGLSSCTKWLQTELLSCSSTILQK